MWTKSSVSIHELYLNPSWWKRNSIGNIVFGLVVFSFSFISHWGAFKNLWLESFSLRREQHIILIPLIEPFDRLDVRAQLKRQLVLGITHHSHARKTLWAPLWSAQVCADQIQYLTLYEKLKQTVLLEQSSMCPRPTRDFSG